MALNTRTHRTNITLPEIFDRVRSLDNKAQQVQMLKSFRELRHLRWFVHAMYNYNFSKAFVPQYELSHYPPDMNGNLWTQAKRFDSALVVLSRGDTNRYEKMMTLVLETLSKEEAELVVNLLNGKKVDGISKRMWREVYPEFFRPEEATTSVEAGTPSKSH